MNKRLIVVGLILVATILGGGCHAVGESAKAQFYRAPVERMVDGNKASVFRAVGETLVALGYVIEHSSPSDGVIVARGSVRNDANYRSAEQLLWRVHVEDAFTGLARVQVEVRQAAEESIGQGGVAMKTERYLADSPTQHHFFEELEQRLKNAAAK